MKRPDTEDKQAWTEGSKLKEKRFVDICQRYHGMDIHLSPEKFGPDLLMYPGPRTAELKARCTPFYTAWRRYEIPVRWAFTYNVRDHERYIAKYPGLFMFFWLSWIKHDPKYTPVEFVDICAWAHLEYVDRVVRQAPIHHYGKRVDDPVNKKRSFVLDIRDFPQFWLTEGRIYL